MEKLNFFRLKVCIQILTTFALILTNIEIFEELRNKNRKSRNQSNERLKRALKKGERRPKKNKKRGSRVPTGSSCKLNHLQNLAKESDPCNLGEEDDDDQEDEE
jgi:hypothetical protein